MDYQYLKDCERTLSFYLHEHEDILSKNEYAWLVERGFVKICGDYNSNFKSAWQVVVLTDPEIQNKLLKLGETVKAKHLDRFETIRKSYVDAVLQTVPSHLRKKMGCGVQFPPCRRTYF